MTIIALLTDFGEADGYVAAMKGTILGIAPEVRFVDISHQVRPQAIDQGAYLLGTVYPYLPVGTIYLAVVDPGVGTERRALALEVPRGRLVGPDNGLFSDVLDQCEDRSADRAARPTAGPAPLPAGCAAVALTNRAIWRPEVSSTFHGRDVFAPVAAHLARGMPLAELGTPVPEVIRLAGSLAVDPTGRRVGRIRHVDRFGNAITSIPLAELAGRAWRVRVGSVSIPGLSRSYGDGHPGELLALVGSSGQLEIAVAMGNAARQLGLDLGAEVIVEPGEE